MNDKNATESATPEQGIRRQPQCRCVIVPVTGPTLNTDGRTKLSWSSSACVWAPREVFVMSKWGRP